MSERTVRRGLAASAVAALAISGLAFAAPPAHADGEDVVLVSQRSGRISLAPDGTDWPTQGVRLTAESSTPR